MEHSQFAAVIITSVACPVADHFQDETDHATVECSLHDLMIETAQPDRVVDGYEINEDHVSRLTSVEDVFFVLGEKTHLIYC